MPASQTQSTDTNAAKADEPASSEKVQPQRPEDEDHADYAYDQHISDVMACHALAGLRRTFYNPLIALNHCNLILMIQSELLALNMRSINRQSAASPDRRVF
jgi:hypothetical protein